ncbi:unnamed protein product [Prunus armeniaca]
MALPCGLVKQSPGWIVSPGRLCQIFGRKSQSLLSGPGLRLMSVIRRGPSRIPRKFGAGLVTNNDDDVLMEDEEDEEEEEEDWETGSDDSDGNEDYYSSDDE